MDKADPMSIYAAFIRILAGPPARHASAVEQQIIADEVAWLRSRYPQAWFAGA